MPLYSCCTCAAQFGEASAPPAACPICSDDRQYVPASGQAWATQEELLGRHYNTLTEVEPGVLAVGVEPKLGIGQQVSVGCTAGGAVGPVVVLCAAVHTALVPCIAGSPAGCATNRQCPCVHAACCLCRVQTHPPLPRTSLNAGLPRPGARRQRAVGLRGLVPPRHCCRCAGSGRHLSHCHQPPPLLQRLRRLGRRF